MSMWRKLLSSKPFLIDAGVLILRIFTGFLIYYGWDKLVNFKEKASYWPDPLHVGSTASLSLTIFAELVCPVFVVLGLFTRVALVPVLFNMAMAILIGHSGQPFVEREHAFSFFMPFLAIFLIGPGKYSIDALRSRGS